MSPSVYSPQTGGVATTSFAVPQSSKGVDPIASTSGSGTPMYDVASGAGTTSTSTPSSLSTPRLASVVGVVHRTPKPSTQQQFPVLRSVTAVPTAVSRLRSSGPANLPHDVDEHRDEEEEDLDDR